MRLAHLHLAQPISYVRSLALQNAVLQRHFNHKDRLRSSPTAQSGGVVDARWQRHQSSQQDDAVVANAGFGMGSDRDLTGVREHGSTKRSSSSFSLSSSSPSLAATGLEPSPDSISPASLSSTDTASSLVNNVDATNPANLPPDPTLITFSTTPTYTVGRRHLQTNPISQTQQDFLSASGAATFYASPRGGLLTYHGPGQLTGYMVADLRRHGITARCWIKLLEDSVMRACATFGVQNTTRTDDPGVWITDTQRKICAIGVQVSRGITSHGVGFNVFDHPIPNDQVDAFNFTEGQLRSASYAPETKGFLSWGFSRIVACGLEGKSVTWLARESGSSSVVKNTASGENRLEIDSTSSVADVFAREIADGINRMKSNGKGELTGVYRIEEDEIMT